MRIFKNRGDIFFSKTNKEKSEEQKILITALVLTVAFTVVFVIVTGAKSNFSVKEFFKPDNLELSTVVTEEETPILPEISGKSNILLLVSEDGKLLFVTLYQADMDNAAYKASCFRADTIIEKQKLGTIFANSGAENVMTAVETLTGASVDYYISADSEKFSELYSLLGEINYPVISEVKYKNNDINVPFSVKVKEGEQTLKASQLIGLVRYYLDAEKNCSLANDLMLTLASQQINETNYDNREELFSRFVSSVGTNITVKDYSAAEDALAVFSNEQTGVKVYNAPAKYKGNEITDDSLKEIKGYFVK